MATLGFGARKVFVKIPTSPRFSDVGHGFINFRKSKLLRTTAARCECQCHYRLYASGWLSMISMATPCKSVRTQVVGIGRKVITVYAGQPDEGSGFNDDLPLCPLASVKMDVGFAPKRSMSSFSRLSSCICASAGPSRGNGINVDTRILGTKDIKTFVCQRESMMTG